MQPSVSRWYPLQAALRLPPPLLMAVGGRVPTQPSDDIDDDDDLGTTTQTQRNRPRPKHITPISFGLTRQRASFVSFQHRDTSVPTKTNTSRAPPPPKGIGLRTAPFLAVCLAIYNDLT
ncbi:hypothetical protein ZHAS_00003619 [Anopheles sinensis]|uniref:Uncharacterized protein n=1 Tax=Anopheles sinensis TaxID=74873 RepID=A0A084VEU5_ANOSI|nr:hypothetical protein ZHAS_00003619 [Anopheles sinensis]